MRLLNRLMPFSCLMYFGIVLYRFLFVILFLLRKDRRPKCKPKQRDTNNGKQFLDHINCVLVCFDDAKVGHNSYNAKNIPARCTKLWGMCMK